MTSIECSICYENINDENKFITDCCHYFCNDCFGKWKESCNGNVTCPNCRTVLEERVSETNVAYFNWEIEPVYNVINEDHIREMDDEENYSEEEEEDEDEENYSDEEEENYNDDEDFVDENEFLKSYKNVDDYNTDRREYISFMNWFYSIPISS